MRREENGMDKVMASRIVGGNSKYKRVASDFYPTPAEATHALLNFLKLPAGATIWEPACGENHMVDVMRAQGYEVIGTDIMTGTDFLTAETVDCDWIITNPPFSLADRFIERCIESKKPFALLLKSQYWHAKKRLELFRSFPPAFILPLTWRPDFTFKQRGKGSPLMDVMWVVWGGCHDTRYIPLEKPSEGVVAV
jgi:hypothetical protein